MSQNESGGKKAVSLSFLFGAMLFSFMIRYALSVVQPVLMKQYHISLKEMGFIASGWNWSYTAALIFAGPIVDALGPWLSMGLGSLIWSLATIAFPIGAGVASFFVLRLIFGFGQGALIPSTATAVSRIFPVNERTRAIATAFSGNVIGLAVASTVAAFIMQQLGWPSVFYVIGGASLALTILWFVFYPDKTRGRVAAQAQPTEKISWGSLLTYRSTWGIAFGQMGYLYAYFFFVTWLPTYLVNERKMTVMKSGIIGSLPFWAGMVGTLAGGWLGDYLIKRGVTTTISRKSIIGLGLSLSTVMVIGAAFAEQVWLCVTLLTLCVGFLRLATGSCNSLPIDLAPKPVVGSLTSIQNFFGNVGGLLAPIATPYIVEATGSFVYALVAAGGMALFGAVAYVFLVGNLERDRIEPVPAASTIQATAAGAA